MPESRLVSLQPFWEIAPKSIRQLIDANSRVVGQALRLKAESSRQECVPGIGMMGIVFSCHPDQPAAHCYGVLEGRGITDWHGILDCYLVRFFPGEFTRLFGLSSDLPAHNGVPLQDLMPVGTLIEEIAQAESDEERHRLIAHFIFSAPSKFLVRKLREQEKQIAANVVGTILDSRGDIRMKELSQETCYSARYLQTLIREHVGLSPKQLCNQIRFQNVLHLLQGTRESSLTLLAQQVGFYDHSHMTRIFKEFTGMCPSDFLQSRFM